MKKILISISEDILKDLDIYCEEEGYTRSKLLTKLIKNEIYKETKLNVTTVTVTEDGKTNSQAFKPSPAQLSTANSELQPMYSPIYGKLTVCPICGKNVYEKKASEHFVNEHPQSQI